MLPDCPPTNTKFAFLPIYRFYTYSESVHQYNHSQTAGSGFFYIRAMCTRLYARMLPLMPHGLRSMASVNCDVSGGIPCQVSDSHSLHKIWLRTSCVIIFSLISIQGASLCRSLGACCIVNSNAVSAHTLTVAICSYFGLVNVPLGGGTKHIPLE